MASNIDATKPAQGELASKADLRANLAAAKAEIEALQAGGGGASVFLNVLDFGAVGNDSTDNTAAIQSAIDAAAAAAASTGGKTLVWFPPGVYRSGTLIMKRMVRLAGSLGGGRGTRQWPVEIKAVSGLTGVLLDWDAGDARGSGAQWISFEGRGANGPLIGARIRSGTSQAYLIGCTFFSFADQGILVQGDVCSIVDCSVGQGLRNRSRASKAGCLQVESPDNWIVRGEYNASMSIEDTVSDENLHICAILITGANNWISESIGEISDVGLRVTGADNRMIGVRCDLNYGNGFEITGQGSVVNGCHAYRNSRAATNTYDGFLVSGRHGAYSGCVAKSLESDAWRHRYGFHDTGTSTSGKARTIYSGCLSENHTSKAFHRASTTGGGAFVLPLMGPEFLLGADPTPSVDGWALWRADYGSATTLTGFADGFAGQRIMIRAVNGNTTLEHGSGIATNTGANKTLVNGRIYSFYSPDGTTWIEEG